MKHYSNKWRKQPPYYPALAKATIRGERVGIRAYTSDFSPFFGKVPDLAGVYAASGLGSSGLDNGSYHWLPSSPIGPRQGFDLGPNKLSNCKLCQTSKKANKNFTEILSLP